MSIDSNIVIIMFHLTIRKELISEHLKARFNLAPSHEYHALTIERKVELQIHSFSITLRRDLYLNRMIAKILKALSAILLFSKSLCAN